MSGEDNERSWTRRSGKQPAIPGRQNVHPASRASRSTLGSQGSQGSRGARLQPAQRLEDDMTTPMATPPLYTSAASVSMPTTHFSTAEYRGGSSSSSGARLEDFGSPTPMTSPPTSTGESHSSGSADRSRTRVRDSRPARETSPVPLDIDGNGKDGRVYGLGSAANEYYGSRSRSQSSDDGGSMGSASQEAQLQEMRAHIDYLRARVDRNEERARATPSTADGIHLHSSSMSRREILDLIDTTDAATNARLGRIEEMMARMVQWMRNHSSRDPPPPDQQ